MAVFSVSLPALCWQIEAGFGELTELCTDAVDKFEHKFRYLSYLFVSPSCQPLVENSVNRAPKAKCVRIHAHIGQSPSCGGLRPPCPPYGASRLRSQLRPPRRGSAPPTAPTAQRLPPHICQQGKEDKAMHLFLSESLIIRICDKMSKNLSDATLTDPHESHRRPKSKRR